MQYLYIYEYRAPCLSVDPLPRGRTGRSFYRVFKVFTRKRQFDLILVCNRSKFAPPLFQLIVSLAVFTTKKNYLKLLFISSKQKRKTQKKNRDTRVVIDYSIDK
uniref:(northern house mosquito) hypothetical protein n=1 Tax=Culex pipiens TaxID=7175 RepID=A0A8D8AEN0_CULPI